MQIAHSRSAAATPAFALIAEGWNDLVQSGLTPDGRGDCPVKADDQVLFAAQDDGEIVGVLCYASSGHRLHIGLAYVEPTSRKRGVVKALYAELVARAKKEGVTRVTVDLHPDNRTAQLVLDKLGHEVVAVSYEAGL